MPVLLATDLLLWLLVAGGLGYFLYCRRRAHLAAPWRRVLQSRAALASLVVLTIFAAVGLVDSLHFRPRIAGSDAYSNEVLSALDLAVAHLRANREKTYSAPFATRLYTKEQIETPDGETARDYPRLAHGGSHLKDESHLALDITLRGGLALAIAGVLSFLVFRSLPRAARRFPDVPWA